MRCPWGMSHIQLTLYWFLLLERWNSSGECNKISATLATAEISFTLSLQIVARSSSQRNITCSGFFEPKTQKVASFFYLQCCGLQSSTTVRAKITIWTGHNNKHYFRTLEFVFLVGYFLQNILTSVLLKNTVVCSDVYWACVSHSTVFNLSFV